MGGEVRMNSKYVGMVSDLDEEFIVLDEDSRFRHFRGWSRLQFMKELKLIQYPIFKI